MSLPGRRQFVANFAGAGVAASLPTGASRLTDEGSAAGVALHSVTEFGAVGDGATDDTAAFKDAIDGVDGATLYVPPGVYVLDNLRVSTSAHLVLDDAAVLRALAPSPTNRMINFSGQSLRIRGGTIDGARAQQTGWPYIILANVPTRVSVSFHRVSFTGTVASTLRASHFGGYIEYTDCSFEDQAEHSGVRGKSSTILTVASGEEGARGFVRFNHNRATWTGTPREPGSNPGGIFVNTQVAGPDHDGVGNDTTVEAIGNHFYGYGQNCAGNDISPLHTYPTVHGMRAVGNYFEACGFCAISAKAVRDFVCTDNVIRNGMYSSRHKATEGAISYVPGYHANGLPSPRGIIANNIVVDPGGESPQQLQRGIRISGSGETLAQNVVVQGNLLQGCGYGISVNLASDVTIDSNQIVQADDQAESGSEMGIRVDNSRGSVSITNNRIHVATGSAVYAVRGVSEANFQVRANVISGTPDSVYALYFRGVGAVRMSGNSADLVRSLFVGGLGSVSTASVEVDAAELPEGSVRLDFADISAVSGHVTSTRTPLGVVTPAGPWVRCTQLGNGDGAPDRVWISRGRSSQSWAELPLD